jgi:hypothetical protein
MINNFKRHYLLLSPSQRERVKTRDEFWWQKEGRSPATKLAHAVHVDKYKPPGIAIIVLNTIAILITPIIFLFFIFEMILLILIILILNQSIPSTIALLPARIRVSN